VLHDGIHRAEQRMLPLFDGVDEPLGRVDLLFDKKHRFFLAFVFLAPGRILSAYPGTLR
jgi:hypothetical protein